MANYLYIIVSKDDEAKVDSFLFSENSLVDEDIFKDKYGDNIRYYISFKVAEDISNNKSIFKGYSIDYDNKTINFTSENASKALKEGSLEGCYLFIEQLEHRVTISNDCFSQLPLLFFAGLNCFACSDSLYVLYMLRKSLGLSIDKDIRGIKSRAWVNSITNQLLSDRTPLASIKYVPPNNFLEVNVYNGRPYAKLKQPKAILSKDFYSYASLTRRAAISIRSLISSVLEAYPISLSLSGGLDSRVILASAIKCKAFHNLSIGTNQSLESDFNIVTELSSKFGFEFNSREKYLSTKTKKIDQLSTYILLSCGIYDSIYCPSTIPEQSLPIPVTGHGAELFKGNYGLRSIDNVAKDCTMNQTLFLEELDRGVHQLNHEVNYELSSELHYLGYRNSLHGARATIFSLYSLRPLMHKPLVDYFTNNILVNIEERKSIVNDLLILLSPELAASRFDSEKKNLNQDYINSRLLFLGGEVEEEECFKFSIIGEPNRKGHSISSFFLNMAKSEGYSGDLKFTSLEPLIYSTSLHINSEFKTEIKYWREILEPLKNPKTNKTERHNMVIGKILSANIYGLD